MGQEVRCLARVGERVVEVKALLESEELILRGEHRARLPFSGLDGVEAADGRLTLHQNGEPIVLELGPAAERWAAKIRNPPTLLGKLGVKDGQSILAVELEDRELRAKLKERVTLYEPLGVNSPSFVHDVLAGEFDIAFLQIETLGTLKKTLPILRESIAEHGAIWVVHPKGRADLKDVDVIEAGKAAGLVDNKVARVSERLSALRFVIPKAKRRPAARSRG